MNGHVRLIRLLTLLTRLGYPLGDGLRQAGEGQAWLQELAGQLAMGTTPPGLPGPFWT